jgi:hypothetical protein
MAQQNGDTSADPIIAFIARGDRELDEDDEAHVLLRESLLPIVQLYEAEYGQNSRRPRFFTYGTKRPHRVKASDPIITFFHEILAEGEENNCDVVFVLKGWDALTCSNFRLADMFQECVDTTIKVSIRVFADEIEGRWNNRRFFDVDPVNVWSEMSGEVDTEADDFVFGPNTQLFIDNIALACARCTWEGASETTRAIVMFPDSLVVLCR